MPQCVNAIIVKGIRQPLQILFVAAYYQAVAKLSLDMVFVMMHKLVLPCTLEQMVEAAVNKGDSGLWRPSY